MSDNRNKNLAKSNSFPIACVGASAGGLEALIALFKSLPKNINMAFVLIQHLEPQHKSALSEILSREASLNIREARNNTKVEPAHVYVIPPNTLMTISRGKLKITSRIKRADGRYLPVDFFMNSLAQEGKEKAIGIILSGTGSDGTQGVKDIKAKGGIIFAQDEKTSRYFGMPSSVIASGSADFVMEPKEIAQKLVDMQTHGYGKALKRVGHHPVAENGLGQILALLQDLVGIDFTHYKQNTIRRRISLRMSFHAIKNYVDYYIYLKKNPSEANVLLKNLLISVTAFFRDPKTFEALRREVFPLVAKNCSSKDPIRVWVPACSSGEEVYSFAISLYEFLESRKMKPCIQIFGTDLSGAIIEKARTAIYPEDISAHVSAGRLRRFFTKTETGYKIAKSIRDLCIFAKHDITTDPPLSNMDIVSCRNLLIYLDTFLQNKALSMLHYALKPKGFLVLGTAESVTALPGLFTAVDNKQKIYSKNIASRKKIPDIGIPGATLKAKRPKAAKKVLPKQVLDKPPIIAKRYMPKVAAFDKKIIGNKVKDITKLRKEFARTEKRLNAISEEKDTFNEELRAANEEIQSSNEELQSMNEELETSKEELQSTNEELLSMNDEMQNKNSELTHLNSDLSNFFSSTNIPIIIVSNDLHIKRFTPMARKVMNLILTDVGRPIGDIKLNIEIVNLEETILGVIEDMIPKEIEVKDKEGRWYSVRIRPYRTIDNKIDGALISLIDIDDVKRSQEEVQSALNYSQAIIETMREPLVVLNNEVSIQSVNKSFCDMFGLRVSDVKGKLLYEIDKHKWDDPKLRELLEKVLPRSNYFNDFELAYDFPETGLKTLVLNGRQIKLHGKNSPLILLVIEDITKRKKAENILKRDKETLDKIINKRSKDLMLLQLELVRSKHLSVIGTMAATVAHELRNPLADIAVSIHRIKKIIKDPLVEEILTIISSRVSESDQIINNILKYSKETKNRREHVKINDIIRSAIDEEAQKLTIGKISIKDKIDCTKDLTIEADPVQIKEVFQNVLHNALEAVHSDTGIIEIETNVDKSMVSILIKDNGEGISKKDLKKVGSPFFTTKTKGTGLGLMVCKQVVGAHKGSLNIKSDAGVGTTVTIKLPKIQKKDA